VLYLIVELVKLTNELSPLITIKSPFDVQSSIIEFLNSNKLPYKFELNTINDESSLSLLHRMFINEQ